MQTPGFHPQPRPSRFEVQKRLGVERDAEILLAIEHGPFGFSRNVILKRLFGMGDPVRQAHEAAAYARTEHPAIVRMLGFVVDDNRPTIVLERVHGHSINRIVSGLRARSSELDETCALYIGYRVFQALAVCAEQAIVHRNVSPMSVLIPWDGYVKVGDFAIAHIRSASTNARPDIVTGNMSYLAPEQLRIETVTERTDVYLGCLLLRELLLRAPIFPRANRTDEEVYDLMARPNLTPLAVHRPDLPEAVTSAIDLGLAVDTRDRNIRACELVDIFRSVLDVERARARLVATIDCLRRDEESFSGARPRPGATLLFNGPRRYS